MASRIGGALALTAGALAIWAWAPDISRNTLSQKYLGAQTSLRKIDGATLRVNDTGLPNGKAIILLHGFGSSLETWSAWALALEPHYRVISFDLPGSGLSLPDPRADYSDKRSVALVTALMDQLGIASAAFVGHSMGGRIAWQFAAAHPSRVTRLVLISPDGFASPGFEYGRAPNVSPLLTWMKYFLPKSLLRKSLAAAYTDPQRPSDSETDRYYELLLASGNRAAMLDRMRQTVLEDPIPVLKSVQVPTLLLWGEKDRMIPYSNAADYLRALPNARLVSFPELGHLLHEEAPAESLRPLETFLAE